jgi:creatinine amidohydrolase
MKHITTFAAVAVCLMTGLSQAQTPPPTTTQAPPQTPPAGRGQRPPQTPEQQAAAAARREAEQNAPRPIDALDSVWTEELTWMEVRDAIKAGKTTALILTGGVESNGPHLATGKHNFILKVMGEAIARKLGNALVAPIVTLEPGRPDAARVVPGSVFLSQETYRAVLTDMATSLKGMGFTTVILLGDSGGNQGAMKAVAEALTAKYPDPPQRFIFIPEYYDYSSVQKLVQSSGIPEQITIGASQGSDGLHEEYGIDALMALYDPKTIRLAERERAKRATINGVSLLPLSKTLEMAKKIVELRTKITVDAIVKALAAK